jgi:putative FmdB family regulatory protein
MPLFTFGCKDCNHEWEVFRHISDEPPKRDRCPKCKGMGARRWQFKQGITFTPYWTDGLTGQWEHVDSVHTEKRRELETGMTRLPNSRPAKLSRPTEKELSWGLRK